MRPRVDEAPRISEQRDGENVSGDPQGTLDDSGLRLGSAAGLRAAAADHGAARTRHKSRGQPTRRRRWRGPRSRLSEPDDADGFAWNVVASVMDFATGHSIGPNFARDELDIFVRLTWQFTLTDF